MAVRSQAKAVGDELVLGLVGESEILKNKGPPVMSNEERFVLVEAVKWVDEVITGEISRERGGIGRQRDQWRTGSKERFLLLAWLLVW